MTLALIVILLLLVAAGLAVGGVYLLAGVAWAMLAGAVILVGFAAVLRLGMKPDE